MVLKAALQKLGDLGQENTTRLLNALHGLEFLARAARVRRWEGMTQDMREVVPDIGCVIKTLAVRYDLDLPTPIANDRLHLEAAGLKKSKKLGL